MIRPRFDADEPDDEPPPVGATRSPCAWETCHPAREVEEAKLALLQMGRRPVARRRGSPPWRNPVVIAAAVIAVGLIVRRSPAVKAAIGAIALVAARTAIQRGVAGFLQRQRF